MNDPTRIDHRMVTHAARRGAVVVARPGGGARLATLICWRKTVARVEYPNGSRATVRTTAVTLP